MCSGKEGAETWGWNSPEGCGFQNQEFAILMIIHENQHNLAVITCVGAQATSHQSTASINSIFFLRIRAHSDQSSSLDDWQPVVLPDCLRYWFPFTLNLSGNSWLFFHFLSHCRGILPEKVDLINVSVIYLPPLKLLSCCRSSSYTVTLLWATPASKLPSTVIRSCGT